MMNTNYPSVSFCRICGVAYYFWILHWWIQEVEADSRPDVLAVELIGCRVAVRIQDWGEGSPSPKAKDCVSRLPAT